MPLPGSDEIESQVARQLAAAPAEDAEETQDSAAPSSGPNAAESAGAASAGKAEGAGQDTVDNASQASVLKSEPPGQPPQAVPYERFAQVNREKNEAMERIKKFEEAQAARVEELARARASALMENVLQRHPQLAAVVRGEPPPQPETLPDDPVQRELTILRKQNDETKAWRQSQEQRQLVRDLEDKIDEAVDKHPIIDKFREKSDGLRQLIEGSIVHRVLANPNADPAKVVEEVAASLREIEEATKADFKQEKREAARKIPVGVGTGAPQPPGVPRVKLSLERPGELTRAVAGALAAQEGQQ